MQPHAQWQDQAKLRRVLAIRLKVFALEKAAPEVCNGSGRQQQVNGLCPDLDPARQIERIARCCWNQPLQQRGQACFESGRRNATQRLVTIDTPLALLEGCRDVVAIEVLAPTVAERR